MMAVVDYMKLLPALFLIAYPLQAAGDVMSIETTGASSQTAQQDGLRYSGVRASHAMAQADLGRMNNYRSIISSVGQRQGVDPAIIAGIISRESRAGNAIKDSRPKPGWGDHNNAFGLMQIDKRYHTPTSSWNSEEHISQGTEILVQMIRRMQNKFPRWSREKQLKGAIAAYNMGAGNVRTYDRMDVGTTGGDYSNDVVARAQYYKGQGY